jgi:hypothetical protein
MTNSSEECLSHIQDDKKHTEIQHGWYSRKMEVNSGSSIRMRTDGEEVVVTMVSDTMDISFCKWDDITYIGQVGDYIRKAKNESANCMESLPVISIDRFCFLNPIDSQNGWYSDKNITENNSYVYVGADDNERIITLATNDIDTSSEEHDDLFYVEEVD